MRAAKRAAEIKAVVDAAGVIPGEDGDEFLAAVNGVPARAYRAGGAWWAGQAQLADADAPFEGWEYLPSMGPAPTGEAALRAAFAVLWPGVDLEVEVNAPSSSPR